MRLVVSGNLLRFTGFTKEVDAPGGTLGEALAGVCARFPSLKPVLLDDEGRVRQVHQLFLNGEQLPRGDLNQRIANEDELAVITALAGG
jgi:molybdopterin converting factor small subunit